MLAPVLFSHLQRQVTLPNASPISINPVDLYGVLFLSLYSVRSGILMSLLLEMSFVGSLVFIEFPAD